MNSYNPDGTPKTDSPAVTNDTLYDLASNTKMYTANYALQYLVTQGKANLDSRLVDLLGSAFVEDTIDITYNGPEGQQAVESRTDPARYPAPSGRLPCRPPVPQRFL